MSFFVTKNKAKLARKHGISRGYLYQLVKDAAWYGSFLLFVKEYYVFSGNDRL